MAYETLYSVLYIQLNLFGIVLLLMIRFKTLGLSKMVAQRIFSTTLDATMLFFASDTVWVLMNEGFLPCLKNIFWLVKDAYFLATSLVCFFWFLYFEYLQESRLVKNSRRMWMTSVFVVIQFILLVVNHFTGFLFYVDDSNVHHRGPAFALLYIFAYIYILFTCLRALIGIFNKEYFYKRKMLIRLAFLPVAPALGGIVQFLVPRLPLVCSTLALTTILMYMDSMDEMVSIDPLTRLNNRKQGAYYYEQIRRTNEDRIPVYLLLVDANKFKGINDTYGHIEGDAALIRIADAMRKSCGILKRRANISRFGGDEFVIMVKEEDPDKIESLKAEIHKNLAKLNEAANVPYELTVSIGMAKTDEKKTTPIKELLEKADQSLYEQKKLRDS